MDNLICHTLDEKECNNNSDCKWNSTNNKCHYKSKKLPLCDALGMTDMNTCSEILSYIRVGDLYTKFGIISMPEILSQLPVSNFADVYALLVVLSDERESELVDIILHYYNIDLEDLLTLASKGGHVNLVKEIFRKARESGILIEFDVGLDEAVRRGYWNIVDEMFNDAAGDDLDVYLNKSMRIAIQEGSLNKVEELIRRGFNDLNAILRFASTHGHLNIVEEMINRGATDLNGALRNAYARQHIDVIEYLINRGAGEMAPHPRHLWRAGGYFDM